MAKLLNFKIPQQAMVGFIAGIFSSVLVWLAGLVQGLANLLITQLQGRTALITGTELGTKVIQQLTGRFVFTIPDLLIAGLGGAVLVMAGTWLYNMKWSPDAIPGLKSTPITKLALVLFYASALATIVLSAFALPAFTTLLVLLVNSLVTAWFVVFVLGKQLKLV